MKWDFFIFKRTISWCLICSLHSSESLSNLVLLIVIDVHDLYSEIFLARKMCLKRILQNKAIHSMRVWVSSTGINLKSIFNMFQTQMKPVHNELDLYSLKSFISIQHVDFIRIIWLVLLQWQTKEGSSLLNNWNYAELEIFGLAVTDRIIFQIVDRMYSSV